MGTVLDELQDAESKWLTSGCKENEERGRHICTGCHGRDRENKARAPEMVLVSRSPFRPSNNNQKISYHCLKTFLFI